MGFNSAFKGLIFTFYQPT